MKPDWKKLAAAAQPATRKVRLCLRGDLLAAAAEADGAERDRLYAEAEAAVVEFTLRGLSRQKYRALEAKHPDPDGGAGWDLDTFPEALVRACMVTPEIEAADPLFDVLTSGQVEKLFEAAFGTCNSVDDLPLRKRG